MNQPLCLSSLLEMGLLKRAALTSNVPFLNDITEFSFFVVHRPSELAEALQRS